ncbi:MAG: hypothetical protein U0802_21225 [Candidatus Binatia bacterium]
MSIFAYGVVSYAIFFATFLSRHRVSSATSAPRTIDGLPQGSLVAAMLEQPRAAGAVRGPAPA